eukprot:3518364-Prymnesium_polylepis.1
MPSIIVSSTISPRSRRALSTSPNASRSSAMLWRVVGTSSLRSSSSAACSDHASRAGIASMRRMWRVVGPTVDTQMCCFASRKPNGCVISSSARCTASALSVGSPIPAARA